jgi:uncharacterized protein
MRTLFLLIGLFASGIAVAQPVVPALTGRVVDTADILTDATEQLLSQMLAAHEDSTTNQVAVLTIPSLDGEAIEPLANRVFNTWRLGQAGSNNGVLLLIARDDRELRIEVGFGLEGDLTDAEAGRIIRNVIVPVFRNGDFNGGTIAGVTAILGTLQGTYTPPEGGSDSDEDMPWWFGSLFFLTHLLLPGFIGLRALVMPPVQRYSTFVFSLFFIAPMLLIFGALIWWGGTGDGIPWLGVGLLAAYLLSWIVADISMTISPKWQDVRKQVKAAVESGKKTKVDAGWISFSAGGSSSSGGGGGFSGGGGSSGGGGASGSW